MAKTQTKPAEAPVTKTIDALGILKNLDDEALTERINELERELEALRVLQKAAHIQKHGKPETAKRQYRKPSTGPKPEGTYSERILKYLEHAGPSTAKKIAEGIGCSEPTVYTHITALGGKVERTAEGYRLKR